MQNAHPTILMPEDHSQLERLMCTMTGSRTALAMLLRRKLDTAVIVPATTARRDFVTSDSIVRFVVDGGRPVERRLTWLPQDDGDTFLSLRLPRGLALLGLSAGQAIAYQTDDGSTEFIEVEQVDPALDTRRGRERFAQSPALDRSTRGWTRVFRQALTRLQRGRTISALERLDDALLKDIGITRGEIPHIADIVSGVVEPPADRRYMAPRRQSISNGRRASAEPEHVK
jgi:Transcription elongation factor